MSEFQKLQYIGNFGLGLGIEFAIIEQNMGDGYDYSILVGSSAGLRSWQLKLSVLPLNMDKAVFVGTERVSLADYIWNFWCDRKREANSSFIITDPKDGKDYLAKFVEHKLSYEMFMTRLFSTGLALQQRREAGVNELPDGSLGLFENPDVI